MYFILIHFTCSIIQNAADLWIYYIFAGCCIYWMIRFTSKIASTCKAFGFSSSFSQRVLLKCVISLSLFGFFWLIGCISALIHLKNASVLVWDKLYMLLGASHCFWFPLSLLISSSSKEASDIEEGLIQTFWFFIVLIFREDIAPASKSGSDYAVFIETFNCGEKYLAEIDLKNTVPLQKDIYIFSLQECFKPDKSLKAISNYLNTNNEYSIQSQSIGSNWKFLGYHGTITVIVAVRRMILCAFNPSLNNTVYEGFNLGFTRLGNKGSAAISIRLPNYSILAIACHFSSDLKVLDGVYHVSHRVSPILKSEFRMLVKPSNHSLLSG